MSITIVKARQKHLPALLTLENACFTLPWSRKMLEGQILSESSVFLAAEDEKGLLLGYGGFLWVLDEGYVANIATSPDFRRRGVADALLKALKERALELSLSFLTLEVRKGNKAAISLYEKHGFVPVGLRKNYYEKPREDALLMTVFF
jgi:ribosomal-protein-alanine N-acetyltransferase